MATNKSGSLNDARASRGALGTLGTPGDPYDLIGLGFGPSNIALAIAAQEIAPERTCLFLERNPDTRWHEGMLIDGARMQISFLKDLVSLRNLASPFTFLAYAKAKNRLEKFVNLGEFRPTRVEFQDYLRWVAEQFAHQVQYNAVVTAVTPVPDDDGGYSLWQVTARDAVTGTASTHYTRNVVHALGGRPNIPPCVRPGRLVAHSSAFLSQFLRHFPDRERAYEFAVAGDGQSAGEIAAYLLGRFPQSRVHLMLPGYALRATDNNPFGNEAFFESSAEDFYASDPPARQAHAAELRATNYGVVRAELLDELYRMTYDDEVRGRPRLFTHRGTRVASAVEDETGVDVGLKHRWGAPGDRLRVDGLMLATGYQRQLDPGIYADVLPYLEMKDGCVIVASDHRVQAAGELGCGLYVQGFAESHFGIGDTLLSLLPFRSKQIITSIAKNSVSTRSGGMSSGSVTAHYPPRQYLEHDIDKMFALIERFSFATLISATEDDFPMVTHLPLVLDRSRGARGTLLGHLDRANPQLPLLDGGDVLVVFHGPNSYISPGLFEADLLPTWNSMSVHVRGRSTLMTSPDALLQQMRRICEVADPGEGRYRLDLSNPRISKIVSNVAGIEIEIEELRGRFKLSQELDDHSRELAAAELMRRSGQVDRDLIEWAAGLPASRA
jgi:L-ornithine N5-monooxygenase